MAPIGLRHLRVELKKLEEQFTAASDGGGNNSAPSNPLSPELLFTVLHLLRTHPEFNGANAPSIDPLASALEKMHPSASKTFGARVVQSPIHKPIAPASPRPSTPVSAPPSPRSPYRGGRMPGRVLFE